jgi:hypothetical protein
MAHKQVSIRYATNKADVDEKIAPLILALWQRGFNTISSCQDYQGVFPGYVWIIFESRTDGQRFQRILKKDGTVQAITPSKEDVVDQETESAAVGKTVWMSLFPVQALTRILKRVQRVARKSKPSLKESAQ